jgi:formylglycine-generating enzyme required for sulfatase activity
MRFRFATLLLLLLVLMVAPARAEKRIALVIGNKDYKSGVGALVNPLNDIHVVGDALKSVGFEVLKPVANGTRGEILAAIYTFASALKAAGPDAIGFLYYSGHGIASQGENYLIPIDVTEPSTEQLRIQGVKQSEVIAILRDEAPNAANYLVLDACRNTLQGSRGGKGFVPVGQQNGVLIAFSTEPGKTAQDTGAGSGPYAAALAAELVKTGQSDLIMFHNIRIDVMDKTNRDQVPWFEDGIERRDRPVFAHAGPDVDKSPQVAPATSMSEAAQAWTAVKDTKSSAELEIFIRRYGDGFYGDLARQRLEQVKAVEAVERETSRLQLLEAQRKVDEERKRREAEAQKSRDEAEARAKAEQAERERLARVEADRKKQQTASLMAPVSGPSISPCSAVLAVTVSWSSRAAKSLSAAEECALKPRDTFKECDKCPEMAVVPAGSFTMGSPSGEPERRDNETQIRVSIAKPFAVGKFAVTFDEWDACVADSGCGGYRPDDLGFGRSNHPVVMVSWNDAKSYVAWLSAKTGKQYRLLSEAEREYVTRAGTTTPFWWGSAITTQQANYNGHWAYNGGSKGEARLGTVPVQTFEPNPWGLYQVHGNVFDWVEDCIRQGTDAAPTDGSAWTAGGCDNRALRGGAWFMQPVYARAASRFFMSPTVQQPIYGFRVARTLTQ